MTHIDASRERPATRADIAPFAWVLNESVTPLDVTDPVLRARPSHEADPVGA